MTKAGVDRLERALPRHRRVRRGGTVSISGVYGGAADPMPMMQMFDKQIQLRMGQANVRAWTDDILEVLEPGRGPSRRRVASPPTGCRWSEAPEAYAKFRDKDDGMVKVVFKP